MKRSVRTVWSTGVSELMHTHSDTQVYISMSFLNRDQAREMVLALEDWIEEQAAFQFQQPITHEE